MFDYSNWIDMKSLWFPFSAKAFQKHSEGMDNVAEK